MTTNTINDDAITAFSEALDDAITMARVNKTLDETEPIARQVLTVLSQFGWELVCTGPQAEKPEAKEINIFEAIAEEGQRNTDV